MPYEIQLAGPGGTEMLRPVDRPVTAPQPGEVLIRQEAIGVNFIDVYHRTGLYPLAYPAVIGVEAAGVVEAVGPGVARFEPGNRVAYAGAPVGAYSKARTFPADKLVKLPDAVPPEAAAGTFLKGLTAHMLLHEIVAVGPGDHVLVHAGAGGLGQILLRWGKALGARMIATVGSAAKAQIAVSAGADHVFLHTQSDWQDAVRDLADGRGVALACDGIGGTMLARTLRCVRPFGTVASIGQAAGAIPPIKVEDLGPARSIAIARPSVMAYSSDPERYARGAAALLDFLTTHRFWPQATQYALIDAARAHEDLEAGRTTGSVVLIPGD